MNTGNIKLKEQQAIALFKMKFSIRESLEIRKNNSVKKSLNDKQLQVYTNAWNPLLMKLKEIDNKNLGRAEQGKHRDLFLYITKKISSLKSQTNIEM